jgi:hypothetical protein
VRLIVRLRNGWDGKGEREPNEEPIMGSPFKGKINVDIRDSVPDWSPFEPPKAPDGAPSVIYAVLDDVGFAAMSCYGGPIDTPNIDRIANAGLRYTQWHTTALCSPPPVVPAHRPQPHAQQHGVHHRSGERVSERQRRDPARERSAPADPRRAGLEHVHGRQSGTCARRRR